MNNGLRDDRRHRIVYCAKAAFAANGYHSTSISQIVQNAGIARGTFYQYFDNKLHIFQTILDSFLQDLQDCIKPVSLSPGSRAPLIQIQDNLTRVLELVLRERELTQILLRHTGAPGDTVERHVDDFYRQVADVIQRSLNLGMAMSLVRPCNTRLTAYSIIGAVKEVVFQLTASEDRQPPVENLVQDLLEFGMRGILGQPQTSLLESNPGSGRTDTSPKLTGSPRVSTVPAR